MQRREEQSREDRERKQGQAEMKREEKKGINGNGDAKRKEFGRGSLIQPTLSDGFSANGKLCLCVTLRL